MADVVFGALASEVRAWSFARLALRIRLFGRRSAAPMPVSQSDAESAAWRALQHGTTCETGEIVHPLLRPFEKL